MADSKLGVAINLRNLAASQYGGINFNSMAVFNGVPVGVSSDGIFTLFNADSDDGTAIEAFGETVTTDFGAPNKKRLRRAYVGYEASEALNLRFKADDGDYDTCRLEPKKAGQKQHSGIVGISTKRKGRYWMLRFENTDGYDFSIDSVDILSIILGLGR